MATPQPIDADQPNERLDGPSRRRRLLEGAGFVVVWVALGYLFPGDDETYLLMGIPLTIAFQVAVRRRPLRELWVTDATRFSLDRRGLLFAAVFIAAPVYFGSTVLADGDWTLIGWYVAAVIGAGCAAFALRATSVVAMLKSASLPLAIGGGGMILALGGAHIVSGEPVELITAVGTTAKYIAIYFPVLFLLEEVAFRGALDAHVHHDGEGRGWQSALFVSSLWGLWHLPITEGMTFPVAVAVVLVVHMSSESRCRLRGAALATCLGWRSRTPRLTPCETHSQWDSENVSHRD